MERDHTRGGLADPVDLKEEPVLFRRSRFGTAGASCRWPGIERVNPHASPR